MHYETQLLHKTLQPQAKSGIQKHENKLKCSCQTRQFVVCYTSIMLKVCPVTFSSRWPCYPFKLYRKHCWISCRRAHTRQAETGANITSDVTCQHASISAKLALIFLKGHLSFKCILTPRQHKSYCNNPAPYQIIWGGDAACSCI